MLNLILAVIVSFFAAIAGGFAVGGSVYYALGEFFPALEVTYAQCTFTVLLWSLLKLSKREVDSHEGDAYDLIWKSLLFDITRAGMIAAMTYTLAQIF